MQNIKKSLSSHCIIIGRKKTHCGNERAINDQIGQEVTYHPLIEVFTNLFFVCRYHKMKDQLGVIATLEVKKRFKHSKSNITFSTNACIMKSERQWKVPTLWMKIDPLKSTYALFGISNGISLHLEVPNVTIWLPSKAPKCFGGEGQQAIFHGVMIIPFSHTFKTLFSLLLLAPKTIFWEPLKKAWLRG